MLASPTRWAVTATAHKHSGHPSATRTSCSEKEATSLGMGLNV